MSVPNSGPFGTGWPGLNPVVENTFLLQLLNCIPATHGWRLRGRPASDPATWCSPGHLNLTEDVCSIVFGPAWSSGGVGIVVLGCCHGLLWGNIARFNLALTTYILIAEVLPLSREIPARLWHTLRAIICWIIWKDRNNHLFGGKHSDVWRMTI